MTTDTKAAWLSSCTNMAAKTTKCHITFNDNFMMHVKLQLLFQDLPEEYSLTKVGERKITPNRITLYISWNYIYVVYE